MIDTEPQNDRGLSHFERFLEKVPGCTLEELSLFLQASTSTVSRWKKKPPDGTLGILFRFLSESKSTNSVLRKLNDYAGQPLPASRLDEIAPPVPKDSIAPSSGEVQEPEELTGNLTPSEKRKLRRRERKEAEQAAILEQRRLDAEARANFDLGKYVHELFQRCSSWREVPADARKVLEFHGMGPHEFLDAFVDWEDKFVNGGSSFNVRDYIGMPMVRDDVDDNSRWEDTSWVTAAGTVPGIVPGTVPGT